VGLFDLVRGLIPGAAATDAFGRGTRLLEHRRLEDAAAAFDEAMAETEDPRQIARIWNKRAIIAVRLDDLPAAVDALIAAFEAEPRTASAIVTLGNLLLESGDVDEAVAHYEYALLIDPDDAAAHHNLGVAMVKRGRRAKAVGLFRKAARLESRSKRGRG